MSYLIKNMTPLTNEIDRLFGGEIKELKFGCCLKNKYTDLSYDEMNIFIEKKGKKITAYRPSFGYCGDFPDDTFEILGRPINLEDVMRAIEIKGVCARYYITQFGELFRSCFENDERVCDWNMGKPLSLQSPETVEKIAEILGVK